MKHIEKIVSIGMLIGAIIFNLWLFRLEPSAKLDPNDNTFQFALVDRTNQIWDFAQRSCASQKSPARNATQSVAGGKVKSTKSSLVTTLKYPVLCTLDYVLLFDHWVPNWAEGYNLPFYYSHIPQILIVGSYRFLQLFTFHFSLFTYYHWIIYLLLSFFPLSVFLALLVLRISPITAGVGALLANHLSTDGLYGLDPSSFLWRGYGLSSQLFAMIFLPLAIAYSYRFFHDNGVRGKEFFEELNIRLKTLVKGRLATNVHLARQGKYSNDQKGVDRASSKNYLPERSLIPAVFFLVATTAGHLGIGIIAILSLIPLAFGPIVLSFLNNPSHNATWLHGYMVKKQHDIHQQFNNPPAGEAGVAIQQLLRFLILTSTTLFFLSYWIVPIVLNNNYHNISFWDPIWKFNSYGWKGTLIRLFNGDLFDFGRLPILTVLVFLGFFASLLHKKRDDSSSPIPHNTYPYSPLAFLFPFWLLLYFGRTTWGGLIDLIPGMKEFHLSRFLVGLHVTGMFLAPIGVETIVSACQRVSVSKNYHSFIRLFVYLFICLLIFPPIYRQTIKYNDLNNTLIKQANENFMKVKPDVDELFQTLVPLKGNGRVFAGRGGSWGKDFRVAETPYYMHMSTYGINTVLWLPETWSLNSDTEQYFSEDQVKDYDLYNIRYVVAPVNQKPQPFWKLLMETNSWKLYEVVQQCNNVTIQQCNFSYFTAGIRSAIVAVDKEAFINVVRLWIQSDYPKRGLFPELTFDKNYPKNTGLPNFKMIDEATYQTPDSSIHSLFNEPPVYTMPNLPTGRAGAKCSFEKTQDRQMPNESKTMQQCNNVTIEKEENDSDMIFTAKISMPKDCLECILILKQTSHPNWQVTIDGKKADRFDVFPFYNAVKVNEGEHEVIFSYKPSKIKLLLLILEIVVVLWLIARIIRKKKALH